MTNLPLDRPRLAERRADGLSRSFRLAPHTAAALAGLGARHGASPYMCTLALLALLLHRQGGDAEVCIGMPSANRNRAELATMVGHFTNVLVLRIRCDAEDDFDGLLRQVRGRVLDAGQHPDVPLDQLIEDAGGRAAAGHASVVPGEVRAADRAASASASAARCGLGEGSSPCRRGRRGPFRSQPGPGRSALRLDRDVFLCVVLGPRSVRRRDHRAAWSPRSNHSPTRSPRRRDVAWP